MLVLAWLPVLLGVVALAQAGPFDPAAPWSLAACALASLGWLLALHAARRVRGLPLSWPLLLASALALRLPALASEIGLSDDLHRYVWEGALLAERVSPYAHAPVVVAEAHPRWSATFVALNHPEVPAAYPPLTLALQAAVVSLAGGAEAPQRARFGLRLTFLLCDLALCLPLVRLLRARGRSPWCVVAWAWSPWVAFEFAGAGHFDAAALLALVGALALWGRARLAACALAVGGLLKLLPLVLVPFLARRARAAPFVVALVVLACGGLFRSWTGAWPRLAGLAEYAFRWESFSLVHRGLESLCARCAPYDEAWSDPRRVARACGLALWLAPLAWAWWRRLAPERVALLAVAGFLVFTPTLHPWYVCWIVPFLALFRWRAFLWLAALAPLLYWPLPLWRAEERWVEPVWLWPLIALPFFALLALDLGTAWRRAR